MSGMTVSFDAEWDDDALIDKFGGHVGICRREPQPLRFEGFTLSAHVDEVSKIAVRLTQRVPTWFKPPEAALILESARLYQPPVEDGSYPYIYPLVATWLLAGLRKGEALGLEVDDVSFKRGTITVSRISGAA